jgi:hypothetical protein
MLWNALVRLHKWGKKVRTEQKMRDDTLSTDSATDNKATQASYFWNTETADGKVITQKTADSNNALVVKWNTTTSNSLQLISRKGRTNNFEISEGPRAICSTT